ncbi:hypothetical protein EV715DRAFT_298058 [Schizophyllum commune]
MENASTRRGDIPPTPSFHPRSAPGTHHFRLSFDGTFVSIAHTRTPQATRAIQRRARQILCAGNLPRFHVDSLGLATVSDLKNACEIDAGALLNVGDTPPLTSTSCPALLRFDTDSRGPPSDVPERIASHAATIFAFDVALLDDASDAFDVTQLDAFNALVAPLSLRVAVLVERSTLLDDVADAFDVALLDALDVAVATLAICVAALIERRWARRARRTSSSTTTR